tara:strand:+ start:2293 stop:3543 length:1251 start_codon:yes stop_codon:yes gene_type:complete
MTMEDDLSIPEITPKGLGYVIKWDDGVEIDMVSFYTHTDYHVDAEISVRDYQQLNPHLLGPLRTGVTRTFRNTISDLNDSAAGRNWKGRLTQATNLALKEYRKGQPVFKLNSMEPPEMPPERITGIAFEGMPTLIYGDGGMGKSTLGVALLTMVQSGIGLTDSFQTVKGNTLVLDFEASWEETWRRNNGIIRGMDLPNDSMIYYRFCASPLAAEVETLRAEIRDKNIDLVLIDSAGPACGGEPEKADATLQYFSALRMLSDFDRPVTTITLAHITKGGGGKNGPFGSVYWTNLPRNTFELKKSQKKGENYIDLAMHHMKTNIGTLREPVGFRMTWGDGIYLEPLDIKHHAALGSDSYCDRSAKLLEEANGTGLSLEDLADEIKVSNLRSFSSSLSRDDRFVSDGTLWHLDATKAEY